MKARWIGGFLLLLTLAIAGWFLVTGAPPGAGESAVAIDGAATDAGAAQGSGGQASGGRGASGGTSGGRGGGRGGPSQDTLVVVSVVERAVTGDRLTSIGDGEAAASVTVVPRDSGVLTEVAVRSGERVSAGDLLARLDSDLEEIARDIAARAVEDATTTRTRVARLVSSRAGARADLDEADNALARAGLALRDAELKLARRSILAPIDGTVGIVRVEPGNRVTTDSEIVTIDDRSTLLIDFRVPERFASRISVGQRVEATSFATSGMLDGEVLAVGSRVDRDSRTLPVRAKIDNGEDRLRPGMSFTVTLRFKGDPLPAVAPLAVQWDSVGSFVWKIVDGTARRTAARIVQRNPETVIVQGDLAAGDAVVIEGVLSLREGASVRVAGGTSGDRSDAGGAAAPRAQDTGRSGT